MSTIFKDISTRELLARYNELADKPLKAWKGKRSVLEDRLAELEAAKAEADAQKAAEKADKSKSAPKATGNTASSSGTIVAASLKWLCHVEYYEDSTKKSSEDNRVSANHPKARSVGLPYLEIIERIKEEFPGCDTSVACLRWYSVKVRAAEFGYEGYRLCQRRPRAKPSSN